MKYAVAGIVILLALVAAVFVSQPRSGHITLLTVSEGNESQGGTADLYLTVTPGSGSIYLDSFPLTKIDTQSSIRYANQIACDMLQEDCSRYDFFYTIRADSSIVGGPSAGAAITVLTVGVLDGQRLDQHTAMTGTINSGGIIGPVAGINAKVRGAKAIGITRVLIPSLTSDKDILPATDASAIVGIGDTGNASGDTIRNTAGNEVGNGTYAPVGNATGDSGGNASGAPADSPTGNDSTTADSTTDNASDNASALPAQEPLRSGTVPQLTDSSITVTRVGTVEDALYYFTGRNYTRDLPPLSVPAQYTQRMSAITDDICNRTATLGAQVRAARLPYNDTNNYTGRSMALANAPDHADHDYSRASLCFSANIELSMVLDRNESVDVLRQQYKQANADAQRTASDMRNRTISTITDLETYAIVMERVLEAQQLLDGMKPESPDPAALAYAQERLVSAHSWMPFFGMPGKQLQLDHAYLERACLAKISEAEERIDYVRLYTPQLVAGSESMLDDARGYSANEPILCVFTASKAKAQADLIASALAVNPQDIGALLTQKLDADTTALRKQQAKGYFPILGYSYAQYAKDLRDDQPYSALTFSEYALELSNIDIYFPKASSIQLPAAAREGSLVFLFGAIFGFALATLLIRARLQRTATRASAPPGATVRMTERVAKGTAKRGTGGRPAAERAAGRRGRR